MTIFANPLFIVLGFLCCILMLRRFLSLGSLLYLLGKWWTWLEERTQAYQTFEIPRYDDERAHENPLYRKASAYLNALPSLERSPHATLFSSERRPNHFQLRLDTNHTACDSFLGARLKWIRKPDSIVLHLRRCDCTRVLRPYLQHVETVGTEIDARRRELKFFTINGPVGSLQWRPVAFTHPATLDTVATDPELKKQVQSDLEKFRISRDYYHCLGRVWTRSYLLHGIPGTDKSGFAAAMANFLRYDVYELDLSCITNSADLRNLFLQTTARSLILVENVERHLMRRSRVGEEGGESTFSGMLDFMDGMLSFHGEEKVMVFTTSCEEWDTTAMQPRRVDMAVKLSMCDFPVFKAMASSYLGVKDHKLYPQVEEVFQGGARLSAVELGEIMIANRESPNRAIKSVISALQRSSSLRNGGSLENSQRMSVSQGRTRSQSWSGNGSCGGEDVGSEGAGKDGTLRELRKLARLMRAKSGRKKDEAPLLEVAAGVPS